MSGANQLVHEAQTGRSLGELVGIIVDQVADHYNLRPADIMGRALNRQITRERHVALALCVEFSLHGNTDIGNHFGMDRTSVDHAARTIHDMAAEGPQFAAVLAGLRQRIEDRAPETRTRRLSAVVLHRQRQEKRTAAPELEREIGHLLRELRRELTDAIRRDPAAFVQGLGEISRSINAREH